MTRCTTRATLLLACAALLAAPVRSGAEELAATAAEPGWSFTATPYLWLFWVEGNVGAGGQEAPVDANFTDLFEHGDTLIGLEVNLQAQNGPWTILVDPTWLRETASFGLDKGPARIEGDVTADLLLLDTMVLREAKRWLIGEKIVEQGMPERSASIDLLGGMRTTVLAGDLDLKLKPPGPLLDSIQKELDTTQSWVDPVIGFRATLNLGRVHASFRGDVGGFTISSDVTSEMWANVLYDFKLLGLDAFTGASFRAIYDDFDGDDGFLYKTWTYGPVIGMGFRF